MKRIIPLSRTAHGPRVTGLPIVITAVVSLMMTAVVASCGSGEAADSPVAMNVRTATVKPTAVPRSYNYPGTVEGRTKVNISTKLMGEIASIPYEEGATVRKGEVVVSIRSDDLRAKRSQIEANRAEADAALANITTNYRRISDLFARKSATQKEMDDIQMGLDMAKAKVKAVNEMENEINDLLQYADLVSPIDGTVVGRFAEPGDLASPGMPLLAVEDTRRLRVSFPVPESEIGLVRRGSKVVVQVGALGPEATFEGTIETVNPSGDPASRQYEAKVGIATAGTADVKPGMYATVVLKTEERQMVTIPEELLVRRGQLDGLFVLSAESEALLRWVRTGERFNDGTVEILSGLSGGENIILTRDPHLEDGMKVGIAQ